MAKHKKKPVSEGCAGDMTPMIDVVFQLIIFFIVTIKMDETVKALKEAGIRDQVKIMAGGAPVTDKFVEEIGADAYGANAGSATEKAKELVS